MLCKIEFLIDPASFECRYNMDKFCIKAAL